MDYLTMGFKRTGGDPVKATEVFLDKNLRKETRAVRAGSLVFVGVLKEVLSTPGRGPIRASGRRRVGTGAIRRDKEGRLRMVRRGAARVNIDITDRVSLPGDPPAPDTGELRNSIDYELTSSTTSIVGSPLEKAAALNFGTIHIRPRPFMQIGFAKAAPLMGPVVAAELRGDGK